MSSFNAKDVQQLADFARTYREALRNVASSAACPVDEQERQWLQGAEQRLEDALNVVDSQLACAWRLPELDGIRKGVLRERQEAWASAVEALYVAIADRTSPNGPLVEVLFVHIRFEKLKRVSAAADRFHEEFERRRGTKYVQRLAAEPEYQFLNPLFDEVQLCRQSLQQCVEPDQMTEEELNAIRSELVQSADRLSLRIEQGRLLAQAALVASPSLFDSLGLSARPRRRASRRPPPPLQRPEPPAQEDSVEPSRKAAAN